MCWICQDRSFRVEDKAIVLVLCNIDTNKNHFFLPPAFYFTVLLRATPLCYVTSFYINRLAVSN